MSAVLNRYFTEDGSELITVEFDKGLATSNWTFNKKTLDKPAFVEKKNLIESYIIGGMTAERVCYIVLGEIL